MSKAIVTGGRGFVGSHLVEHLLKNTDWDIVVFDKMGYASFSRDRLHDIEVWQQNQHRVTEYHIDLTLPVPETVHAEIGYVDYIFHLAAESHVDRSLEEPRPFIVNNVQATITMLEYARLSKPKMFVNFSTDEVYGPAPDYFAFGEFEWHNPSNPYSASKSAQEAIGIAYCRSFEVPVVTTHTMNIIGERQHPEKFVPMVVRSVLNGDVVKIHASSEGVPGSRMYLHARNLADALLHIVELGYDNYDEWNIAGLEEWDNLQLALFIADIVGKPLNYELMDFHSARPGHDLRYALSSSKLLGTGYEYPVDFRESLIRTVEWTVENKERWL